MDLHHIRFRASFCPMGECTVRDAYTHLHIVLTLTPAEDSHI
jgi:hypothetical protein